jgi:hypothetical protein
MIGVHSNSLHMPQHSACRASAGIFSSATASGGDDDDDDATAVVFLDCAARLTSVAQSTSFCVTGRSAIATVAVLCFSALISQSVIALECFLL